MLSPLALGWVFFYSYTKRFTREWPGVIVMDDATKQLVSAKWASLGIPGADR